MVPKRSLAMHLSGFFSFVNFPDFKIIAYFASFLHQKPIASCYYSS